VLRVSLYLAVLSAAWLGGSRCAVAGPLYSDPYGAGSPDVLGDASNYDIESLELRDLTSTHLAIAIRLNYHAGDTTLAYFADPAASYAAVPVGVGDVLIQGQNFRWAIPLVAAGMGGGGIGGYSLSEPVALGEPVTRSTIFPGSIYRVPSFLTAGQVLGVPAAPDLRADEYVWGQIDQAGADYFGSFPLVTVVSGSELEILIQANISGGAFYDDVKNGFHIHFASATCACDVIDGSYPLPEPSAAALAFAALAAAATLRLRAHRA
jgi:hypothetical protein